MSNYSDDDYLRLLAKYNHAERQLEAAQARIAELEAALERIDRESREEMGACQDVFDLGEIARAALAKGEP
jgi:hypothetical protein